MYNNTVCTQYNKCCTEVKSYGYVPVAVLIKVMAHMDNRPFMNQSTLMMASDVSSDFYPFPVMLVFICCVELLII